MQIKWLEKSDRHIESDFRIGVDNMRIAIWIIAICEVIRVLQYAIQLFAIMRDASARDNAYQEFVKSLKSTDKEYVEKMLREFEENDKAES